MKHVYSFKDIPSTHNVTAVIWNLHQFQKLSTKQGACCCFFLSIDLRQKCYSCNEDIEEIRAFTFQRNQHLEKANLDVPMTSGVSFMNTLCGVCKQAPITLQLTRGKMRLFLAPST